MGVQFNEKGTQMTAALLGQILDRGNGSGDKRKRIHKNLQYTNAMFNI